MRSRREYAVPFLLGLLVLLTLGAGGINSLFRFSEWETGYNAADAVWVRDAADGRDGHWTNVFNALGKTAEGGNFQVTIGNNSLAQGVVLYYGTTAYLSLGDSSLQPLVAYNLGHANYPFANVYSYNYNNIYNYADFVPTNSASSNLVMTYTDQSIRHLIITNNITITNITPPPLGIRSTFTWRIDPQLINRGINIGAVGAPAYGVLIRTNINNPVWLTLTNGARYTLVIDFFGTNGNAGMTAW